MDVDGAAYRGVRRPSVHDIDDAMNRLVRLDAEQRCAEDALRLAVHQHLHEASRLARSRVIARKGVGSVFGLPLSGLPAWLLWRAYYLSKMPTLGRKVRIFVEWTWGMFFPNDMTHLRFTRSLELDPGAAAPGAATPTLGVAGRTEGSLV